MFHTKQQRKDLCADCPVARIADIIGDSGVQLIIRDLLKGPQRFGDFEKSLVGVSTRTLTKKLRLLEMQGMLIRKKSKGNTLHIEYMLTEKGKGLKAVMIAMQKYGEKYLMK